MPNGKINQNHVVIGEFLLIFTLFFLLYLFLGMGLVKTDYFKYYNLAFDFDNFRVYSLLTQKEPDLIGFKHPFLLLFRPIGLVTLWLTGDATIAVSVVMAFVGALACGLVFIYFLIRGLDYLNAFACTIIFGLSSTQIVTAITPESYGFAVLTIVASWLLLACHLKNGSSSIVQFTLLGVLTAGVTITNALHTIVSAIGYVWTGSVKSTVKSYLIRISWFGLFFVLLFLVFWWDWIVTLWNDPVALLKSIWWQQGGNDKTSISQLFLVFGFYGFLSPDFTYIKLPESTVMLDARDFLYTQYEVFVILLFWLLCGFALKQSLNKNIPILVVLIGVTLLGNFIFHAFYQNRGSLFLYAGHFHFLICAIVFDGLKNIKTQSSKNVIFLLLIFIACFFGYSNVQKFSTDFQKNFSPAQTECEAPCASGS